MDLSSLAAVFSHVRRFRARGTDVAVVVLAAAELFSHVALSVSPQVGRTALPRISAIRRRFPAGSQAPLPRPTLCLRRKEGSNRARRPGPASLGRASSSRGASVPERLRDVLLGNIRRNQLLQAIGHVERRCVP